MLSSSERAFDQLAEADWLQAFAAHPRIGERRLRGRGFAASEQARAATAPAPVLAALEEGNRLYEQRFGFVFLVFATGKSAQEMLAILQQRLGSTRAQEIESAAAEQRKITRLRLQQSGLASESPKRNREP